MAERRAHRPWRLLPRHRALPTRVVEALLLPAFRWRESRSSNRCPLAKEATLPSAYSTTSVAIIGGASPGGRSVGVGDVMHGFDGDGVGASGQRGGCIRAHKLLPGHLLPGRKYVGIEQLRAVDPGRDRVLPGGEERGAADRLGQRDGLPVGDMLLRGFPGRQTSGLRAGDPRRRRVADRILFRRLVADPLAAPVLLLEQARLPPTTRSPDTACPPRPRP